VRRKAERFQYPVGDAIDRVRISIQIKDMATGVATIGRRNSVRPPLFHEIWLNCRAIPPKRHLKRQRAQRKIRCSLKRGMETGVFLQSRVVSVPIHSGFSRLKGRDREDSARRCSRRDKRA